MSIESLTPASPTPASELPGPVLMDNRHQTIHGVVLSCLSIINYLLYFGVSAFLAHRLSADDFNDYNVALSTLLILATVVTLGLEKYALQCLPQYQARADWNGVAGYLRFSALTIAVVSGVLIAIAYFSFHYSVTPKAEREHIEVIVMLLQLPLVGWFLFYLEVATARGQLLVSAAIHRLGIPLAVVGLNAFMFGTLQRHDALSAVLCYGGGWGFNLLLLGLVLRWSQPTQLRAASPRYEPRAWLERSVTFLGYSLLMTVQAHAGVLVLKYYHPEQTVVSAYAVAAQTGTMIAILATSTNRLYLPQLALALENRDRASILRVGRQRLWFIGPLAVLFLAVIWLAGDQILHIFGSRYENAWLPLCIIASGCAVSTLFAVAPYSLKFLDLNRVSLGLTAVATLCGLGLAFALGKQYGATGAAIAYAVPLAVLFLSLRMVAMWKLREYLK